MSLQIPVTRRTGPEDHDIIEMDVSTSVFRRQIFFVANSVLITNFSIEGRDQLKAGCKRRGQPSSPAGSYAHQPCSLFERPGWRVIFRVLHALWYERGRHSRSR